MYIDESGDPGYPLVSGRPRPTRHYILSGYILPKMDWADMNYRINRFRENALHRTISKYPLFPSNYEFHGTDIVFPNDNSIFTRLKIDFDDRIEFYKDSIKSFICNFNMAKIFSVAVDKSNNRLGDKNSTNDIKYFTWYHLPARFERFLFYKELEINRQIKISGRIIADQSFNKFIHRIFDEKMQKDLIQHYVYGYINIPWIHLEDKPLFVSSKNTLIQIADMIAYAAKLYFLMDSLTVLNKLDNLYKWLEPLYLKEGTTTSNDAIYRM